MIHSDNPLDAAPVSERRAYAASALPYHLAHAGQFDTLKRLLLNGQFLRVKLGISNVQALIDDYDLMLSARLPASDAIRAVQEALRLSSHILAEDRDQLAPQLFGRLPVGIHSELDSLLGQVKPPTPWLKPLIPGLASSSSLLRTFRHGEPVYGLAITSDGEQLAAASRSIKGWKLSDGVQSFEHPSTGPLVMELLVSDEGPNGSKLVSVGQDGTVSILDLGSGAHLHSLSTLGGVRAAALTSDGRFLITAPDAIYAEIWDLHRSKRVRKLEDPNAPQGFASWQMAEAGYWQWDGRGHRRAITCLTVSSNDQQVFSGSDDKQLIAWRIFSGTVDWQRRYAAGVRAVVEAAPGEVVCALGDGAIVLQYAHQPDEEVVIGNHAAVRSLAVSFDAGLLASGAEDGSIKLWDLAMRSELESPTGHAARRLRGAFHREITKLAFLPQGRALASASSDSTVRIWRTQAQKGATLPALSKADMRRQLRASIHRVADAGWTLLMASEESLAAIDIRTGEIQAHSVKSGRVGVLAITPDGSVFAAGLDNGTVVTGGAGESRIDRLEVGKLPITALALTRDGQYGYAALSNGRILTVDIRAHAVSATWDTGCRDLEELVIGSDQTTLLGFSEQTSALFAWDLRSGASVGTMREFGEGRQPAGISRIRPAANGSKVIYVHYSQDDHTFGTWDPRARFVSRLVVPHGVGLHALSNSGHWAAVGTRDHCVEILDLTVPRRARLAEGHHEYLTAMSFTAGDTRLVTCSGGGEAALWNLDGSLVHRFALGEGRATGAMMSPCGSVLICGHENGSLTVWDIHSRDLVARFWTDAPIEPVHLAPDARTIVAVDATTQVHLLSIENLPTTTVYPRVTEELRRPRASLTGRAGEWWRWRYHSRRGAVASRQRDWHGAEREYRVAAAAAEALGLNSELARTLDALEFAVAMRKNGEVLAARAENQ